MASVTGALRLGVAEGGPVVVRRRLSLGTGSRLRRATWFSRRRPRCPPVAGVLSLRRCSCLNRHGLGRRRVPLLQRFDHAVMPAVFDRGCPQAGKILLGSLRLRRRSPWQQQTAGSGNVPVVNHAGASRAGQGDVDGDAPWISPYLPPGWEQDFWNAKRPVMPACEPGLGLTRKPGRPRRPAANRSPGPLRASELAS